MSLAFSSTAQRSGVKFRNDYWLEKAIQIAKLEDKNVLIDTYAPWCGPCKLMDIQFQDENLGAYFNEKYINVRIDMDGPYGEALREKYDVFFLPTILILDKHGNPKYVSEGLLSSDELLSIGAYHHNAIYNPAALMNSSTSSDIAQYKARKEVDTNPFGSKGTFENPFESRSPVTTTETETTVIETKSEDIAEIAEATPDDDILQIPNEKIIYTANDQSESPDYLFNYTYLKLELQDGTHWAAAEKYLNTQTDWSSEKNIRFIYDFVRSTNSKEFRHIIENREKYNELFGKESVDLSIEIIANQDLFQRYPRPETKEVFELFRLKKGQNPDKAAYLYLLERYEEEQDFPAYVTTGAEYLEKYNSKDYVMINKIAMYYEDSNQEIPIEYIISLTKSALDAQGGTSYELYDALANLYYQNKNKRKALAMIKKAKEYALEKNVDTFSIDNLFERIKAL